MKLKALALLVVLLPLLPAFAQSGQLTLTLYPYGHLLQKGGTLKVLLVIGHSGNESMNVDLSAFYLPAGTSAWFEPQSGMTNFTSVLTLMATNDAIPGDYSILIRATSNETVVDEEFEFRIASQTDFKLEPQDPIVNVGLGSFVLTNISVKSILSYKNWVKLYTWDPPTGISVKFGEEGGLPDYNSTVSIAVKSSLTPGLYILPISGVGTGGIIHTVYLALSVLPESEIIMNVYPEESGTTNPSPGSHSCRSGASVKVEAFPNEGWRFDHWLVNDHVMERENPASLNVSGVVNVTAVFGEMPQEFDLEVEPPSLSLGRGGSSITTVRVSPGWNFTDFVSLSVEDLPPAVGCTMSKHGGYGEFESTLNITATTSTPLGIQRIKVVGNSGNLTKSTELILLIYSAPPQFIVSSRPAVITIQEGGSHEVRVAVISLYGYNETVSLYVPKLPPRLTASFDQGIGVPTFYSTLTLKASKGILPGSYYLLIVGSDGSTERSCKLLVKVISSS